MVSRLLKAVIRLSFTWKLHQMWQIQLSKDSKVAFGNFFPISSKIYLYRWSLYVRMIIYGVHVEIMFANKEQAMLQE